MQRRIVQPTQSLCLSRCQDYGDFACLLARVCDKQCPLEIETFRDDRGHWDGRFTAVIRQCDLGAWSVSGALLDPYLYEVPFIGLAGVGLVSAHAEAFDRRLAEVRPAVWATAVSSPQLSEAGMTYDGKEVCLLLILSASCVARAMNGHLTFVAADTPQARPVHEELTDFARCLRRLARGTYPITMTLDERGVVLVDLDLDHLGDDRALYAPSAPVSLDLAGDCILAAHAAEVDDFVAGFAPDEWQRLATAWRFRHWGLSLDGNRARLSADANRVWRSINARLCAAASPTE